MRSGLWLRIVMACSVFLLVVGQADVARGGASPPVQSNTLHVLRGDGTEERLDVTDCTDLLPNGETVFCPCQAVAFRVAQIMADRWPDGVFHCSDAVVSTGWRTDGPQDLFVEKLGMEQGPEGFRYGREAAETADQYLEDAWYRVTIPSQGAIYTLRATERIYGATDDSGATLLDYRRRIAGGDTSCKQAMQALRAEVSRRLQACPFAAGSFVVTKTEQQ